MNDLFEKHKEWATEEAKRKFQRDKPAYTIVDDYVTAALLGLWHAAESFDPNQNVKFKTFAKHRVIGAIADWKRENLRIFTRTFDKARRADERYIFSIDASLFPDGNPHPATIGVEDTRCDTTIEQEEFQRILDLMPEIQAQRLEMHVCYFMKQREIAEVFGVTESGVCQNLKTAIKNFARIYGNRNNVRTQVARNRKNKKAVVETGS